MKKGHRNSFDIPCFLIKFEFQKPQKLSQKGAKIRGLFQPNLHSVSRGKVMVFFFDQKTSKNDDLKFEQKINQNRLQIYKKVIKYNIQFYIVFLE